MTIIDRYISEKFYELMIDSSASRNSTARYGQYLAFKNVKLSIDLNVNKADAAHVQFEIESIESIESLTIDTSIETMKFHIIKIDTSFLISLADLNRLKAYFYNVINI